MHKREFRSNMAKQNINKGLNSCMNIEDNFARSFEDYCKNYDFLILVEVPHISII
jgi:hypothetical protein